MKNKKLIVDFDSTFIKTEGLEELAKIALFDRQDKYQVVAEIARITNEGMEGNLSFTESLRKRIEILGAQKKHVIELSEHLKTQVSDSIKKNKAWFKKNRDLIYVFSGGFHDFLDETLLEYEIKTENIFANYFLYDKEGRVTGFDEDNDMSQPGGKVKALQKLNLSGEVIVVGDGWTDYEMKEAGLATKFFAFTENIRREKVLKVSDGKVMNFDEVIKSFSI